MLQLNGVNSGFAGMKYLFFAVAAILPASSAMAQASPDYRVRVGVGAQVQPDFIGSDHSDVAPLFHINTAKGATPFRFGAPDDRAGIALVSSNGFSAGPAVNLASGRKESDVGAPVGKVGRTIEAGAFAQYEAGDSFRIRGELVKGINGHKGIVGAVSVDKIWRDGDRYVFSLGPRVQFGDGRYERAFFGVSPRAALATGLPEYRPGGGIHSVGVASSASYQLTSRWGLFGFARYERLVGDAAKSPIVRDYGSRNQLSAGIGVNYTFDIQLF